MLKWILIGAMTVALLIAVYKIIFTIVSAKSNSPEKSKNKIGKKNAELKSAPSTDEARDKANKEPETEEKKLEELRLRMTLSKYKTASKTLESDYEKFSQSTSDSRAYYNLTVSISDAMEMARELHLEEDIESLEAMSKRAHEAFYSGI